MCIISGEPHKPEGPPNTLVKESMMEKIAPLLALGFCGFVLATCVLGLTIACISLWVEAYDMLIGWIQ